MNNAEFQTEAQELPSCRFILIRDIRRALNGFDFNYMPLSTKKITPVKGIKENDWISYFQEFKRFKKFGLPHGKGPLHELPWVIHFLDFMDDTHSIVEAWRVNHSTDNSEITPAEVGL